MFADDPKARCFGGTPWAWFSPDGRQFIAPDSPTRVSFWDIAEGKKLRQLSFDKDLAAFVLAPNGKHFLTVSRNPKNDGGLNDDSLELRITDTGKVICSFPTTGLHHLAAFFPDSMAIVVYNKVELRVWDAATGKQRRCITDQLDNCHELYSLAISPDGRYLAAGGGRGGRGWAVGRSGPAPRPPDNPIQIWDLDSGKALLRLERHHAAVESLAWSPDGRILASADARGFICLWEVASGKELTCYNTEPNGVHYIAFAPQGDTLASAMDDTTVLVWDVAPIASRKPGILALTMQERKQRWADLAGEDAEASYRAVWDFVTFPVDTVAFFKERLHPVSDVTSERLDQLIAHLDSDTFAQREAATKELSRLGVVAEPTLRKVLKGSPSVECRRRIETLLKALPDWVVKDPETLRSLRAIWILQRIATPEAHALLERLAAGAPAARQTQEAKAAIQYLDRIKKR